ncbi:MAG: beta-ketoacyl synthase N-terminal-like domain-containing protein, partial [Thermoanaerobaculia bacterium]
MQRRTPHPGRNGHETSLAAWLQDELSHIACGILGVNQSDVAADRVLVDLGFDSVGLTSFANAINQKFRLDITPVLFFDYPSLREIAKHLSTERQDDIRPFHGSAATTPRQPEPAVAGTARISAEPRAAYDPIAIVGLAGVMPQSEDLDALWEGLRSSRDMITVIPEDRWNWEDYYGDPLREVNKSNSRWGGFMKEVDKFDPLFFGISPREAQMMDPQQRIFLETVWKAIEDSGQKPSELGGTRTGVFVGVGSNDYIDILRSHPIALDGYTASGNSHSVLANRVSFLLDLRGPSAPIDTACSSSLVALHRAVESIRAGNCDMAIAGGVQVILSPGAYISFGKAGMLSSDGKCRTFDRRANGYVRGEGCGVVLLKPLSLAEADGNHIYAVIRSTAENHGGRVTTMTAPNSAAQAALLIEAYEKANIDPTTVGYIECHGTGTSLGDPIEVQALTKAFGELYKRHNRAPAAAPHCGLGTIKSNIGHLETAAGIAGVLKVVLALHRKEIPATIHFEELNPFINLKGTPFSIVDELTPWQAAVGEDGAPLPRRAGVSSFGFGGANAHAVLEEYVAHERPGSSTGPQLIVLSAKNADRLNAYVQSMRAYVEKRAFNLADFAYTLQIGREEMPERLAFAVTSIEELRRTFDAIVAGPLPEGCYRNHVAGDESTTADEARIASLIEKKDLARLAELWVSGASIDWHSLHDSGGPRRISVPTYPFARVRYWIPSAEGRFRPTMEPARAGAVQEEPAAVLRSLVPAWNPVPAESICRIAVSESTRVLLLGTEASDLDWVRTSYPAAELLELAPSASADEIAKKLAASPFDQLLWIAPETGDDAPLVAQQESGVLSVFRIVKALLGLGYASRPLQWTL